MWAFVVKIFWAIVTSYIISMFTRPKSQDAKAQNPDGIATIDDSAIIPVLFGTRELTQNNVLWYGDTQIEAITKSGGKK